MTNLHQTREDFVETEDPIQALWDKRGLENTEDLPDQLQKDLELHHILKYISSEMNVLDVGCGNGRVTNEIAKIATRVDGLEYAPSILSKAIGKYSGDNLAFHQGDVRRLQFSDSSYDIVLSCPPA